MKKLKMTETELGARIDAMVRLELSGGGRVQKSSLAAKIMDGWHPPEGPDAAIYQVATYHAVKAIIGRVIRGKKCSAADPRQMSFVDIKGMEHLQAFYAVGKDESELVALEAMTVKELRDKAREHRAMGRGHYKHAEELDQYADAKEVEDQPQPSPN